MTYFYIFYKKLRIKWVLCNFSREEINSITNNVLECLPTVKSPFYGVLSCEKEEDLYRIYEILKEEYKLIQKDDGLFPENLLYQKIMNFINNNSVWKDYK